MRLSAIQKYLRMKEEPLSTNSLHLNAATSPGVQKSWTGPTSKDICVYRFFQRDWKMAKGLPTQQPARRTTLVEREIFSLLGLGDLPGWASFHPTMDQRERM